MAQKAINPKLLWETLFWVLYQYRKLTPSKKQERSIRGFQHGDGKLVQTAIKAVRMAWHHEIKDQAEGHKPKIDFDSTKRATIDRLAQDHHWDKQTRNYISSCVSTYISWDSRGQADVSKTKLKLVTMFASMFYDPNNEMTEVT